MVFDSKAVIVTGGGSGIGRACCRLFAERGAQVAVVDLDEKSANETAEEITRSGGKAQSFPADVTSAQDAEKVVRDVVAAFGGGGGGLHALVNNAGILRYGTVVTTSEKTWDEVLRVNLTGAFLMSKYAVPEIIRQGGGAIVNVGSVQSCGAVANSVAYVASKHGVLGLTRSLAVDHGDKNIRANCVCPGAIDTPMFRWGVAQSARPEEMLETDRQMHALNRLGKPEEVAQVIVFLASEEASFVSGAAYYVEGGLMSAIGGMAAQRSALSEPENS